jgi:hypothetical protein
MLRVRARWHQEGASEEIVAMKVRGRHMKKVKLSEEDRCAIDLVLEQRAAANNGGVSGLEQCFGKPSASLLKRVQKVTQLLDVLAQMPAEDPPMNLLESTLRFVQQHQHEVPRAQPTLSRRPGAIHHLGAANRSLH